MLIKRNFGSFSNDINESHYNEKTGIYRLKRTIYIFIPKESYNLRNFTYGKIVIKNDVVYKSDTALYMSISFPDSHTIRSAIYFGTFATPEPGNIRHPFAKCDINCATTSERIVMKDNETVSISPSIWNKKTLCARADDFDDSQYWNLNEMLEPESIILTPQYYTDLDMQNRNEDYYSINSELDFSYKLSDLIDNNTTIIYMDINKYDTMRISFHGYNSPYLENTCKDSIDVGTQLKSSFASFVGSGTTFIYDSDAKGMNQDGVMYHGGSVAFGKDYTKQYLAENLGGALELFSSTCKDIASKYGHIRAMYNPAAIGDKFKINFKDYKTSPIITPSEIADNGCVVKGSESNTNPISGIDNEFTNDIYVNEILSNFQDANIDSFNMEVS